MGVSAQNLVDKTSKFSVGGYGELVYQNYQYSDNFNRYTYPEQYEDVDSRAVVDIPHLVFTMGYDFGKGWSMFTEVEFEHGGTGGAVEIEAEEFGEFEQEIEKGGEIVLEQFYLEKTFNTALNLRIGHFVVPVGATNNRHLPTQYFTVLRPESETTILPTTWHQTGVSLWGRYKKLRYEVQLVNGLRVEGFGSANWIKEGTASPYEFSLATNLAGALRLDYYNVVPGLRLGMSGYYGKSAANSLKASRYDGLDGAVSVGSVDGEYLVDNLIVRANFVYGNISDTKEISSINKGLPGESPSPHSNVAKNAMCYSASIGYDVLSLIGNGEQRLLPFVRYDYYDSMANTEDGILDDARYERNVYTAGINYFPIPKLVIKAEYGMRTFTSDYNTENTFSLGIMFAGLFTK